MDRNELIIFDGAMGTELYNKGLTDECNELLNLTDICVISSIHKAYADNGAEYVKTNTFGASPLKLRKTANEYRCAEINAKAVHAARLSGAKVAGDIGPSGELYYPYGNVSTMDIYNSYLVQAKALSGADIILIETLSSLVEANLAYLAIRSVNRDVPVIISFTYTMGFTMMGCTPELIAKAFNGTDIFAIGTNCSGGPLELINVVKEYKKFSNKRISAMPNAGLPVLKDDLVTYPFSAEDFAGAMTEIIRAGADIIGGCCGTTPHHIKALATIDISNLERTLFIQEKNKYITTENTFRLLDNAVDTTPDDGEILSIEDKGQIARIDVTQINDLEEYFNNLNMLSNLPKCFTARKDQELSVRILYHGITDIVIKN